jgi:hypothetical protein
MKDNVTRVHTEMDRWGQPLNLSALQKVTQRWMLVNNLVVRKVRALWLPAAFTLGALLGFAIG